MPHRHVGRIQGYGAAMYSLGVVVHYACRLSAAVSVLAAEVPRGDGVFTKRALEHGKTVHRFDGVMSHICNCSRFAEG